MLKPYVDIYAGKVIRIQVRLTQGYLSGLESKNGNINPIDFLH